MYVKERVSDGINRQDPLVRGMRPSDEEDTIDRKANYKPSLYYLFPRNTVHKIFPTTENEKKKETRPLYTWLVLRLYTDGSKGPYVPLEQVHLVVYSFSSISSSFFSKRLKKTFFSQTSRE